MLCDFPALQPVLAEASTAASYSESSSVFNARLDASAMPANDAAKIKAPVSSLRQLASVPSFTPGQSDEKPLIQRDPQASFRALYRESKAIVTSEMEQRIEKSEEPHSRRLTQPE